MKNLLKPQLLPIFVIICGAIGALLRIWLWNTAMQEQHLLASNHPADILCWILSAVVFLVVLILCFPLVKAPKYAFNFPCSIPGFIGCLAAGVAIGVVSAQILTQKTDFIDIAVGIVGILAAGSLLSLGFLRKDGKKPVVLLHAAVCLFFMLYLVFSYRHWSATPQIQFYGFQLLALVFLMISTYQRAAFDANMGKRRSYAVVRLMATYFCLMCTPYSENALFYVAMMLWAVTDLCSLIPYRPSTEEQSHESP